jgi:hypothetical protein
VSHRKLAHNRGGTLTARRRRGPLGLVTAAGVLIIAGSAIGGPAWAAGASDGDQRNHNAHGLATASAAANEAKARSAGSTTQPQPSSNADFSGHGANIHGSYDSTRDGSLSGNGNGAGAAVGKPCAGCVGKADNKNPPGQHPDGSDANAGYECDRNRGIGNTNPAHTGCRAVSPPSNGEKPNGEEPNGEKPPVAQRPIERPSAPVPPAAALTQPAELAKTGATAWLLPAAVGMLLAGAILAAAGRGSYRYRHR